MAVTAGRCGCAQLRRDTNSIGIAALISALITGGELLSLGWLQIRYLRWSEGVRGKSKDREELCGARGGAKHPL